MRIPPGQARHGYSRLRESMNRLPGSTWTVSYDDLGWLASRYPPAAALARLLASPRWEALDPVGYRVRRRSTLEAPAEPRGPGRERPGVNVPIPPVMTAA